MLIKSSGVALFLGIALAACSPSNVLKPYKVDIRQGNFVTQEMVNRLQPGMTKEQVRFVLGTPMVADLFHENRWDYVYHYRPGRGEPEQRHITVFFDGGRFAKVEGALPEVEKANNTAQTRVVEVSSAPVDASSAVVTTPIVPR